MTEKPRIYGTADDDDKAEAGDQGMRGERTADQRVDDPALRHAVPTANGDIVVQETSGTAFAEATARTDEDDQEE